jgi:protoheme ferro-lyase
MILMAVSAFGQSAKKSYKAGMEFVDNLKYDDAIVQFTSAIVSNLQTLITIMPEDRLLKKYQNIKKQKQILKSPWFLLLKA